SRQLQLKGELSQRAFVLAHRPCPRARRPAVTFRSVRLAATAQLISVCDSHPKVPASMSSTLSLVTQKVRELLCCGRGLCPDNGCVVHDSSKPVRDDCGSVGEAATSDAVRSLTGLIGSDCEVPAMRDRLDGEASCRLQGRTRPPRRNDLVSSGQRRPCFPD